ncbi:DUF1850 domain-containing protein [Psychrobacter sp.]|uniref:DUF1850 domain-containing protein n=1 Tax=Psychrobacter sp. TaxID=56811 RepID=UPI0025FAB0D4|nr:DUF1850 domain-containing protein [Psychrobacter sp.]
MKGRHTIIHLKDQFKQYRLTGLFYSILIALTLIAMGLVTKALFFSKHPVITVQFYDHECVIKNHFKLKWIHSVEKQWWIESYQINKNQLLLTDTYFQTFGAGTPSNGKLGKENALYPGYVHYQVDVELPYLNWMISSNIKAQILTDQQALPIYKWVEDYTNIYIFTSMQSQWNLLRQESCNEYAHRQT